MFDVFSILAKVTRFILDVNERQNEHLSSPTDHLFASSSKKQTLKPILDSV